VNLDGKRALVTGGARRIGRAIVRALQARGARVAIHCNRSRREAEELAGAGPGGVVLVADLADRSARAGLVGEAVERLGGLDILVNNASVYEDAALDEIDDGHWDRALEINLTAPFFLAREAGLWMRREGGGGAIVNLTDGELDRPRPRHLAYFAAKAGLAAVTAGLARTLAPQVRVNAVAPGPIVLPEDSGEELAAAVRRATPLGRLGGEESISSTVIYLLCNDFVTGSTIRVDGGRSLK
jgi:pteridine reductase